MKQASLIVLFVGLLFLAASCDEDRTPVPGIDFSLFVQGAEIRILDTNRQKNFAVAGSEPLDPTSADDEVLVVDASILSGDTANVQGWPVSVSDEAGLTRLPSLALTITYEAETDPDGIRWVFVVPKESKSFTLNLPSGITVPLE
jgi:hypothetical protein